MEKVSIIGLDLAKRSFQAHGASADGGVSFRKAYGIFLLIIVGGIAFGLFLEPLKVLTLLIWVFLVAGVFFGVESWLTKNR